MTAEIAILNPHGVALAADSAVTIGSQKIINSAIKLFSLSKTEPVGVMVYGNANLLNIPWETLIKIYRKEHAKNRFEKLENYAESFLSFLKARVTIFDLNIQDQWLEKQIIFIFDFIKNQLQNDVTQKIVRGESVTADDEEKFIIEILTKIRDFHSGYEPTWSGDISPAKSKIELVSEPIIKHYFKEFLKNSDVISLLNEIVILTVTNNGFIEAWQSKT
ncbi:hypothetical protein MSC36_15520 [Acinetobacter baumannii]|uniref:hypothetical protein n=1 Tax=Acinetobacter baumannii TaxID=470 RepID=UPI0029410B78|nr:hypothetical protein [Acinetobacter baumannii]MDV4247332.1 hypothetical protein [Acinetobacter baumannii]